MITLTFEEVKELQTYCLEIPGKYGNSIINFFNVKLEQAKQQKELPNQEEDPKEPISPPAPEEIAKMNVVGAEIESSKTPADQNT